jgi:ParB family chromosome partitioning protein
MTEGVALEAPQNAGAAPVELAKKTSGPRPEIRTELLEIRLSDLLQDDNLRAVEQDASLKELAESIKEKGILQPVSVQRVGKKHGKDQYQLVFGYRRCAAAKLAKLLVVPAFVQFDNTSPASAASLNEIREVQLVENLQRQDLNPIDEAKAFKSILASGVTQGELAKRIGKSQPYVANRIRLLDLPEQGQQLVADGKVSTHVVAEILKLPVAAETERKRLVRQVEEQLKQNGEVSPREFRWSVNAAQRSYSYRRAKQELVEKAKFPTCMVEGCGKKGRAPSRYDPGGDFRCSQGHSWSSTTGKLAPKERSSSGGGYRPPPPPKLPEVNPQVLTTLDPAQVARRLLEAAKAYKGIRLSWRQGSIASLHLTVDLAAAKGARIPEFEFKDGHKFLELQSASWQPDDHRRKVAAAERADLEAWLGTFGKAGRKAPAPSGKKSTSGRR